MIPLLPVDLVFSDFVTWDSHLQLAGPDLDRQERFACSDARLLPGMLCMICRSRNDCTCAIRQTCLGG